MITINQRSILALRALGFWVDKCEQRVPHTRYTTRDLFEWVDILAYSPAIPGVCGVQATDGSNHSKRAQKILALGEPVIDWLRCGNRAVVMSWAEQGRPKRWTCRVQAVTLKDFTEAFDNAPFWSSTYITNPRGLALRLGAA